MTGELNWEGFAGPSPSGAASELGAGGTPQACVLQAAHDLHVKIPAMLGRFHSLQLLQENKAKATEGSRA